MEDNFRAGVASAVGGIATNILVYVFFTILGILTKDPFLVKLMNTDFIRWFIIVLGAVLLIELFMDFVNAVISISYAIGLIIGGIIVFTVFGEITNIIIGLLGVLFRALIEILKRYESYSSWF